MATREARALLRVWAKGVGIPRREGLSEGVAGIAGLGGVCQVEEEEGHTKQRVRKQV